MVKVKGCVGPDGIRVNLRVDPKLKQDMERLSHRNRVQDFDSTILMDGESGGGKSVLAKNSVAPLLADKYSNIHVCFEGDDLIKKMTDPKTERYSVLILDESTNSLASGQAMKKEFQKIRNIMMLCRQQNYFLILILPSFFLLNVIFAVFRSNILYHVKTHDGERGYYHCYGKTSKQNLYLRGKKTMSYSSSAQKKDYRGRFALNKHLDEIICPDYIQLKRQHFLDQAEADKDGKKTARGDFANTILEDVTLNLKLLAKSDKNFKKHFTINEIARICGVNSGTIDNTIVRLKSIDKYDKSLYSKADIKKKNRAEALQVAKNLKPTDPNTILYAVEHDVCELEPKGEKKDD